MWDIFCLGQKMFQIRATCPIYGAITLHVQKLLET